MGLRQCPCDYVGYSPALQALFTITTSDFVQVSSSRLWATHFKHQHNSGRSAAYDLRTSQVHMVRVDNSCFVSSHSTSRGAVASWFGVSRRIVL
eukprot:363141-Chlamydomonas_euryale.AAC.9